MTTPVRKGLTFLSCRNLAFSSSRSCPQRHAWRNGTPRVHFLRESSIDMRNVEIVSNRRDNRRSFLKKGALAASAATVGAGLLSNTAQGSGRLTPGDAALLRFAAAAEILESDFWVQYNELGGVQDSEVPDGTGNPT